VAPANHFSYRTRRSVRANLFYFSLVLQRDKQAVRSIFEYVERKDLESAAEISKDSKDFLARTLTYG